MSKGGKEKLGPALLARPRGAAWKLALRKHVNNLAGRRARALLWESVEHSMRRATVSEEPELWQFLRLPHRKPQHARFDALFVSNAMIPPRGGGTRSFLHFAGQLRSAGLKVAAICRGPEIKTFQFQEIDFRWIVHDDDLLEAASEMEYDRLYCQQHWAPRASALAQENGRPFWYFLRSIDDITPSRPGVYSAEEIAAEARAMDGTRPIKDLIENAERVIANSHFIKRVVFEAWQRECDVVYPGIDPPEKWESKPGHLQQHILAMGGSTKKGIHIVLELARAFPAETFIICGVKRLPSNVRQRDLPSNVFWLGQLNPSAAYALARFVLMPSQWAEPAGRVSPEALMRGIPVLASAVGGIPEIVQEPRFLVKDFENGEAWKEQLRKLLSVKDYADLRSCALNLGDRYLKMQKLPLDLLEAARETRGTP